MALWNATTEYVKQFKSESKSEKKRKQMEYYGDNIYQ